MVKYRLLGRLFRAFVYIQCPWTSLACVLIKSLLAIPPGVAWWDPSHVIPPISGLFPLFLSSSTCPLNSPQSPVPHQSFDRLPLPTSQGEECRDKTQTAKTIKAPSASLLIVIRLVTDCFLLVHPVSPPANLHFPLFLKPAITFLKVIFLHFVFTLPSSEHTDAA